MNLLSIRIADVTTSHLRSRYFSGFLPASGILPPAWAPISRRAALQVPFRFEDLPREQACTRAERPLRNPSRRPGGPASLSPSSRTPESSACSETPAADSDGALRSWPATLRCPPSLRACRGGWGLTSAWLLSAGQAGLSLQLIFGTNGVGMWREINQLKTW